MSRIDEFIGQGLLPFVGREEETEKILSFWRSVPEAQRLRVMLLIAEAGVGKSRLLEECLRAVHSERGAIVHVKLYPEAANSLGTLLSRSLWSSAAGRSILHGQPGENLPDVVAGLQRLSRLRPTLLVLEDIHLFPLESIPDLARLFDAIVDETISVLCLSRPTSFAAQGVLERYLIESLTMEGLQPEALARLWSELFGSTPPDGAIERLYATTRGNGLAIRSALRGAVQNGALRKDQRSGEWKLSDSIEAFEGVLRRSVSLVVEGMVAHLDREKRAAAELLASLGEVFARETAIGLDPQIAPLLDTLLDQGIIVETIHPVSPLAGKPVKESEKPFIVPFPASSYPLLAFTHSLLHSYLADHATVEATILFRIVSEDYPLYSLLPLRLFETVTLPPGMEIAPITATIHRLSAVAQMLDRTAQWRNAAELLRPLNRLLEYVEADSRVDDEQKVVWRSHIQHASLSILRRSMRSPEWIALHERQLETTRDPHSYEMAQYRILTKSFELWRIGIDKSYDEGKQVIEEVDAIIEEHPKIASEIAHTYVLESLVEKAYGHGDHETIRRVQGRTQELLSSPTLPPGTRQMLIERILPNILVTFETSEELHERQESIAIIEEYRGEDDPYYGSSKVQFLGLMGRFDELHFLSDLVVQRARERGLWMSAMTVFDWRLIGRAGTGYSLQSLADEEMALLKIAQQEEKHPLLLSNAAMTWVSLGLLNGDLDEGLRRAETLGFNLTSLPSAVQSIVNLWRGDIESLRTTEVRAFRTTMYLRGQVVSTWKRVAAIDRSGGNNDEILAELLSLLDYPILQLFDILTPRGTLQLWKGMTGELPPDVLKESLIRVTIDRLEWLETRGIGPFMKPLIALLEELDETDEAKRWKERMGEVEVVLPSEVTQESSDEKIRISMLGTIRVAMPGEEFAPIRGVRIRTLLGLMVADRMIGTPLSQEEFLSLAGGEESDPEHARKKKNMAVVRLREIVGHDAVLTEGPTPQLNPDLISVDLLEIDSLIRRALEAARHDAFVRALPLIEEALESYRGEVPFPTLYENFFEAARNDFEYRLRQGIVEIGGGMIAMGDAAGAEPFLRKAFEVLPGDEEIADLLREALEGTGNRIEAERVRLKPIQK